MSPELVVRESITIDAPPEKVWEVLTEPRWTKQYMYGCEIVSDWKPGGSFAWRGGDGITYVKGTLRASEPGARLEFTTFDLNAKDLQDIPSNYTTVTMVLSRTGKSTELGVAQGDFAAVANGEKRYSEAQGWGAILKQIKQLAEQRSA